MSQTQQMDRIATAALTPETDKTGAGKPDPRGDAQATKRPKGKAPRIYLAVAAALVAVWGMGCAYFSSHFVPGTTVNGRDVSNMSVEDLAKAVDGDATTWKASVSGDGMSLELSATDIGLKADGDTLAQDALEATDARAWPINLINHQQIRTESGMSVDDGKLLEAIAAAVDVHNADATGPINATGAYNGDTRQFEVVEQKLGTAVDAERTASKVAAEAKALSPSVTLGNDELVQPTVSADSPELASAIEKANAMLAVEIPLTKDGTEVARVTRDSSSSWICIGEDLSVSVSQESVAQWANDSLAAEVAKSDEVNDYALDAASIAQSVAAGIRDLKSDSIEIPLAIVNSRPPESEGHETRGRHIDVNLTTQYARFYDSDGTVIWRSYLVSGKVSEGRSTPTGTYRINAKRQNETLVGADEDGDGEPDYRSHVTYWMPFIGNAVGLHDASWRSKFGGTIYVYGGSHGCVNLPTDAAAQLYSLVKVGDTVYVHK